MAQGAKRAAAAHGAAPVQALVFMPGVRGMRSAGDVYARTGLDPSIFKGRKAVIYKPPKTPTQNGKHNGQDWKIQFDMQQKWSNPLMGWTSGKDTLGSQVFGHLSFDSPEKAKAYCDSLNIECRIEAVRESQVNKKIAKRYEDNFRWDGDEEDGNTGFGHWASGRSGTK